MHFKVLLATNLKDTVIRVVFLSETLNQLLFSLEGMMLPSIVCGNIVFHVEHSFILLEKRGDL